jgi:hypothetical protein
MLNITGWGCWMVDPNRVFWFPNWLCAIGGPFDCAKPGPRLFPWPPAKFKFVVRFARLASKSPATRPGLLCAWFAAAILLVPFVAGNPPNPPPNKSLDAGFDPWGWSMSPKKFAPGAPPPPLMSNVFWGAGGGAAVLAPAFNTLAKGLAPDNCRRSAELLAGSLCLTGGHGNWRGLMH